MRNICGTLRRQRSRQRYSRKFPAVRRSSPRASLPPWRCCEPPHRPRVSCNAWKVRDRPGEFAPRPEQEICLSEKARAEFCRRRPMIWNFFESLNFGAHLLVDLVFAHEKPERLGGCCESVRDAHVLFLERANHLAQRSVFPTDPVGIS